MSDVRSCRLDGPHYVTENNGSVGVRDLGVVDFEPVSVVVPCSIQA